MAKTEFGGSAFLNKLPVEIGSLYRIRNEKISFTDYNLQTWVFIMRFRLNNWAISYSYDLNVARDSDQFLLENSGPTHEIGFTIDLDPSRKSGGCPGVMDNSALFKDIYNNNLLNQNKPGRNFR